MAIHEKKHGIIDTLDHKPGTTAAGGETNLIGTDSTPAIVEETLEALGSAASASKVPRRTTGGHLKVPTSGQSADEALSKQQIEALIATGVWAEPVHSFVANHILATVGDTITTGNQTTDPALAVNDLVVNTTDGKIYTVTSVAGGTTGNLVTYDAGVLLTSPQNRIDKSSDRQWLFDSDASVWIDLGGASHAQQHSMTSPSDHTAGNNKVFESNSTGQVVELAKGGQDQPLLSDGLTALMKFGTLRFAPSVVVSASVTPVDTDVASWNLDTIGIVVGSGGRVFGAYKNASDIYYVEFTGI